MPRRARIAVAGIPWHIIQRGNNRSACFYSPGDYSLYRHLLEEQAQKHACAIHAYCLMTNHVHILLTPETASGPSLMMKNLGQRYVQYINRTYQRSGTLWEGRFRSCLAQSENYLLVQKGDPPALPGRHPKFDSSGSLIVTPKCEPPSNTQGRNHETSKQFKSHPMGV
jgi:REP element-mobilizing transposase RayT